MLQETTSSLRGLYGINCHILQGREAANVGHQLFIQL